METRIIAALTFVILLIWGCQSPRLQYDYDTLADFGVYSTFSWLDTVPLGPRLDTMADEAVRRAVEGALTSRGLQGVSSGGELGVLYHVGEKANVNVPAAGYAYWPDRWAWGGYYLGAAGYVFPADALIIDLIDKKKEQLIWRGSLEKVFRRGSPSQIAARIQVSVDSIMTKFPPPMLGQGKGGG